MDKPTAEYFSNLTDKELKQVLQEEIDGRIADGRAIEISKGVYINTKCLDNVSSIKSKKMKQ